MKKHGNHPTQKPLSVLRRVIQASTSETMLILNPFCGSGTTGIAAAELNRRFIGIDNDPVYLDMLQLNGMKRVSKITTIITKIDLTGFFIKVPFFYTKLLFSQHSFDILISYIREGDYQMAVVKVFQDGSFVEFARGSFDNWCVYMTTTNGQRYAPIDNEYFTFFKVVASQYGKFAVYNAFYQNL
ncbi:MAG: site-specific DNA-methyltransferase [Bacillus subtilis]|nr:site-specific DNA-methyltransferase [Bacillus subtilis]